MAAGMVVDGYSSEEGLPRTWARRPRFLQQLLAADTPATWRSRGRQLRERGPGRPCHFLPRLPRGDLPLMPQRVATLHDCAGKPVLVTGTREP